MSRGPMVLLLIACALAVACELPSMRQGCVVRNLSGVYCPGCGGKRAAAHLLEGDWTGAARDNLLIYPIAAGALWSGVAFAANRRGGRRWRQPFEISRRIMWWLLAAMALFTLLRNLPGAWFLRP